MSTSLGIEIQQAKNWTACLRREGRVQSISLKTKTTSSHITLAISASPAVFLTLFVGISGSFAPSYKDLPVQHQPCPRWATWDQILIEELQARQYFLQESGVYHICPMLDLQQPKPWCECSMLLWYLPLQYSQSAVPWPAIYMTWLWAPLACHMVGTAPDWPSP